MKVRCFSVFCPRIKSHAAQLTFFLCINWGMHICLDCFFFITTQSLWFIFKQNSLLPTVMQMQCRQTFNVFDYMCIKHLMAN